MTIFCGTKYFLLSNLPVITQVTTHENVEGHEMSKYTSKLKSTKDWRTNSQVEHYLISTKIKYTRWKCKIVTVMSYVVVAHAVAMSR